MGKMGFRYVERKTPRARKRPGRSYVAVGRKPKLGTGERFEALEEGLKKKGARSPGALAAWIGRRKYGPKRFTALSVAGRKRRRRK